ncbi:hypothetical protein BXQ17_13720 [Polaribacter sp. BM10]|uniref:hypothetical protein n=1 Tax=Polaribacter sp. BM10 TaxID=1529069 RepID=UPI00098A15AE|nr:hypothetical protein [Polaribacter sp. BM10]AQS95073.1 hypothetical protein BXQ17_13720 [Polaribacter sp. BM10]
MKPTLILCCFLIIFSCNKEKTILKKPSFLIGKWIRVEKADSTLTLETWHKNFTGEGITLKDKDTTFYEQMEIINLKDTLYLKVVGVNETATLFKFTKQTDTSFICENLENEFPTKIKYYLENKLLKAEVSNNDFKIDFAFKKR